MKRGCQTGLQRYTISETLQNIFKKFHKNSNDPAMSASDRIQPGPAYLRSTFTIGKRSQSPSNQAELTLSPLSSYPQNKNRSRPNYLLVSPNLLIDGLSDFISHAVFLTRQIPENTSERIHLPGSPFQLYFSFRTSLTFHENARDSLNEAFDLISSTEAPTRSSYLPEAVSQLEVEGLNDASV